jgi:mitotic spindle assembly checkpoint protein MAD1
MVPPNANVKLDLTKSRQSETILQKDISSLKAQLESLEKVVKLSRTRVLELKDNPTSRHQIIQKKHLDQLSSENAALLQRLQGKGIGVPKETIERIKGELERMETLVAQKEKRMMRLKEVYLLIDMVDIDMDRKVPGIPRGSVLTFRIST